MKKYNPAQLQGLQQRAYNVGCKAWREASEDDKREAGAWYHEAQSIASECGKVAGFQPIDARVRGAVAIAVLSPRTRWSLNIRAARALARGDVEGAKRDVIARFVDKAVRAFDPSLTMDEVIALATGPKVEEFALACMGDPDACVWDSHMLRSVGLHDKALGNAGVRDALTKGMRKAAREAGCDTVTIQALVWGVVRGALR